MEQQKAKKQKPRGRPFVKGMTGNPRGRPKENEDVKKAAREYTIESIERLAFWMRSGNPKASVSAADRLLDRAWGRPSQDLNHSGEVVMSVSLAAALDAMKLRNAP
jgi:hypothetical protein